MQSLLANDLIDYLSSKDFKEISDNAKNNIEVIITNIKKECLHAARLGFYSALCKVPIGTEDYNKIIQELAKQGFAVSIVDDDILVEWSGE